MKELLKEVLSLAEGNPDWLDDAARYFEDYASQRNEYEKARCQLLAAVDRERAQFSPSVTRTASQNLAADGASELRFEIT
jgi:hypothetical protein